MNPQERWDAAMAQIEQDYTAAKAKLLAAANAAKASPDYTTADEARYQRIVEINAAFHREND